MSVGWQPQRPMTADRKRSPDRGYSPQNCSSRQVATIDTKHVEASPEKVTHHVKKGDPDKSWWLWVVSTASVHWLTTLHETHHRDGSTPVWAVSEP